MRITIWVLTGYMEDEPGHPVVFRPIVSCDKSFIDQKYGQCAVNKQQRTCVAWGCKMTRHLIEVPTTEGRE